MVAQPLLILTGPPGAGKTTVARLVAGHYDRSSVIEADWFWTTIVRGFVLQWEPEADDQNRTVVRSVIATAARMSEGGYATVIDGIVGPWYLDLIRHELQPTTVPVRYVVLRPDLPTCLERAAGRAGEERFQGHPALTDPGPIRYMWQQFADLGTYEHHVIDNTGCSSEATAEMVRAGLAEDSFILASGSEGQAP